MAERGVALISFRRRAPTRTRCAWCSNVETLAPAIFTGWDVRSVARFGNNVYFGTSDGKIMLADSGGHG